MVKVRRLEQKIFLEQIQKKVIGKIRNIIVRDVFSRREAYMGKG